MCVWSELTLAHSKASGKWNLPPEKWEILRYRYGSGGNLAMTAPSSVLVASSLQSLLTFFLSLGLYGCLPAYGATSGGSG